MDKVVSAKSNSNEKAKKKYNEQILKEIMQKMGRDYGLTRVIVKS